MSDGTACTSAARTRVTTAPRFPRRLLSFRRHDELPLDKYLAFALQVAVDAGRVALEHYQTGVAVELKADASPVTRADRAPSK